MAIKSLFDIFKGINKKFIPYGADADKNLIKQKSDNSYAGANGASITVNGTVYTVGLGSVKDVGTYYYDGPSGTTTKISGMNNNLSTQNFKLIVMKPWNINSTSNYRQQILITTDLHIYGRRFSTDWSDWRKLDKD